MKSIISTTFFCFLTTFMFAQDVNWERISDVELKEKEDYVNYEADALACAKYLINANGENTAKAKAAFVFMFVWCQGTPGHSFPIDHTLSKVTKGGNEKLMTIYMAILVEYALGQEGDLADNKKTKLYCFGQLAEYCERSKSNIKQTKGVKKLIKASKGGKLEEYIK